MDFFGAQASARRQSRLLSLGFAACVTVVVLALNVVVLAALRITYAFGENPEPMGESLGAWALVHPGTVLLTTLVVGGFIGIASMVRMLQLREGGGYVARSVGGVRVERDTPDPRRRLLYNVVEEMSLASGVPVPEVYVLEKVEGINAFAAGHTPANAAVAVSRGALQHLNRDQLQGVIAHEFSHILNGDMRLSMRLIGLVFGLMAVSLAGRLMIRLGAGERRGVWPVVALGGCIALVGYLGYWAGRLLQAWISRTREVLADASAVQFTRQSEGLRDALLRAAAVGPGGYQFGAGLDEVAHMLFVPATRRLLATHPPLLERIRALDPHVNQGQLDAMLRRTREQLQRERQAPPAAAPAAQPGRSGIAPAGIPVPAAAVLIAASAGDPGPRHLEHALAVRRALPAALRASLEAPEQAEPMLLAIAIFAGTPVRTGRLDRLDALFGEGMHARVQHFADVAAPLTPQLRLPAVLQLMPALRALPPHERLRFTQGLRAMMREQGDPDAFEYALEKLVLRALQDSSRTREPHGTLSLADCQRELGIVFSVLAGHGATSSTRARQAYEAGLAPLLPQHRPAYSVIDNWVPVFDEALDRLCQLRVAAKQLLVESLVRTIAHDQMLSTAEAELLRTICAVLECPLPPVLPPPA